MSAKRSILRALPLSFLPSLLPPSFPLCHPFTLASSLLLSFLPSFLPSNFSYLICSVPPALLSSSPFAPSLLCYFLQNLVRSPCSLSPFFLPSSHLSPPSLSFFLLSPSLPLSVYLSLPSLMSLQFPCLFLFLPPFPPSRAGHNLIDQPTLLLVFFCSSFDKQFTQFFKCLF